MIFSPNKYEIYCCILRNTMQHLIIKNGYRKNYLKNLEKINRFEALISQDIEPLDIKNFSLEILKAIYIKKTENSQNFSFKLNDTGVYLINKKRFTSLLLTLCLYSKRIEINLYKEKILISSFDTEFIELTKLLNLLNAKYFFERKKKNLFVLISATKTDKLPAKCEKDWEYLLNPLSVVNIYLNSNTEN